MAPTLPTSPTSGWQFSLYPDAGEGGGSYQRWIRKPSPYVARGAATDPERSAVEAGRRPRAHLRRYCAANRLNRLGTLTYAPPFCHEPERIRNDLAEFFRSLRVALGGSPLPYVWVPEWHKTGNRLHAHFAVGRYIKRSLIDAAWGHGFVHIKLLRDLPVGSGTLSEARRAAGYLSKYVAKTFSDPTVRALGLHRYDVAQGFQPEAVTITGSSVEAVLGEASAVVAESPSATWFSRESDGWEGPPSVWAQWGQ